MRDRGYQVDEAIDQMHVLDQDVHQAQVVKDDEHWEERWKSNKPPMQKLINDGLKWMQQPENQKAILNAALAVATVVLPNKGAAGNIKKVFGAVVPFVRGGGGK